MIHSDACWPLSFQAFVERESPASFEGDLLAAAVGGLRVDGVLLAGACVGAADALDAALLLAVDVVSCKEEGRCQHNNGKDGGQIHAISSFLRFCVDRSGLGALGVLVQTILLVEVGSGSPADQDHEGDHAQHGDKAGDEGLAEVALGEEGAELVDQEGHGVAGAQLEADGAPEPALALHLGVHGADGGEAGRGVEVEEEVSQGGDGGETHGHGNVVGAAGEGQLIHIDEGGQTIDHGQSTDHVLLGDEAGDGRSGQLPHTEAQGDQQEGEGRGDGGQDGSALHALLHHLEVPSWT